VRRYQEDRKRWSDPAGAFFPSESVEAAATLAVCRANLEGHPAEDEWVKRGLDLSAGAFPLPQEKPAIVSSRRPTTRRTFTSSSGWRR